MGVRVQVREGESIEEALKRFKRTLWRFGPAGSGTKQPKWYKKQLEYYLKPSHRRRRRWLREQANKRAVPLDKQGRIPKRLSKKKSSWPRYWKFGGVRLLYRNP